jgi:predicted permease
MDMASLSGAFTQIFIMLIVVAVGYLATKLGYITAHGYQSINSLLIHIALPCMIIASVADLDPSVGASRVPAAFAMAFLQFILLVAITWVCNIVLRTPGWQRPLYLFGNVCTNTGFICLPVIASIYGDDTILISSIYVLVCNLALGTIGMATLQVGSQEYGPAPDHLPSLPTGTVPQSEQKSLRERLSQVSLTPKMLLNAPLIACIIALALFFSGYHLPELVNAPIALIGRICTPLAMMIVGSALAQSDLRTVFGEWRFYPFILIRQVALPLASVLIAARIISDPVLLWVFAIMFAAPVGSMVPAWADSFNQDGIWAAKLTVVSTLAFFLALPVLVVAMSAL